MGADSISFCVRVMVGLIILYDHVHKDGAFGKGSRIDVSFNNSRLNLFFRGQFCRLSTIRPVNSIP